MLTIVSMIKSKPLLAFFLRYLLLFFLLFMSVASVALHNIIAVESNPFFYANF
jgi:hypothetical protein